MSSVYVPSSLWADRSGCRLTHFIRFFYSWNFMMSQRTVEQPELKDLTCTRVFLITGKFMLMNISVVNILSSAAESTPKQRVSISSQPISQSDGHKQERGAQADVQNQRWRFTFSIGRLNFISLFWKILTVTGVSQRPHRGMNCVSCKAALVKHRADESFHLRLQSYSWEPPLQTGSAGEQWGSKVGS